MQLTDVIKWENPNNLPIPKSRKILAILHDEIHLIYGNYLFIDGVYTYKGHEIEWWADLPKTPIELEKEEDAYFT